MSKIATSRILTLGDYVDFGRAWADTHQLWLANDELAEFYPEFRKYRHYNNASKKNCKLEIIAHSDPHPDRLEITCYESGMRRHVSGINIHVHFAKLDGERTELTQAFAMWLRDVISHGPENTVHLQFRYEEE